MSASKKMFRHWQSDKVPKGAKRSDKWPTIRKHYLAKFPACAVCGATKGKMEVHHIKPFHTHPQLELEPKNFITLCENMKDGVSCHLLFGHLGNFKSFNVHVKEDAKAWANKIIKRPKAGGG